MNIYILVNIILYMIQYECPFCGKPYETNGELMAHISNEHNDKLRFN